MTFRLEIRLKDAMADALGASVQKKSKAYFGFDVDDVRVIRVLTLDAHFEAPQLSRIQTEIFTNPVTEKSAYSPMQRNFDWLIRVGFRPGVRDTAGSTAREAIEDLLGITFKPGEAVYTSKCYEIRGNLSRDQVHRMATELLANAAIQQWEIFSPEDWDINEGLGYLVPKVIPAHEPEVKTLSMESNEELKRISNERNLALQDRDIPVIRAYFLRKDIQQERKKVGLDLPTDVELEYISQARSDHCNHNTFRGKFNYHNLYTGKKETIDSLFKTCIETPTLKLKAEKDWVVSVLWDNAGVARFDADHYYCITGETHNSPSNMEAYGGSITGIVGLYRDPMGT